MPTAEQNSAFDITITFSEAVNGFQVSDLTLTGPATASLKSGSDGDDEYTVTITPNTNSEGDVTIQVPAGAAQNFTLNNNTASNKPEVHVDTIVPTVEITGVPAAEQNSAFDITITFSETVNGFGVGDLTITGSATITLKSGSDGDSEYTATITPDANSEGDVTIQVSANTVKDFALNDNTASNKPEVHIDTIPPGVESITGVPDTEKNVAFDITITFSEAVNGFEVSDLTLTGPATASLKSGSDGDSEYTATITPNANSEGDVTIQVPAGAARDFALNNNTASVVTDSVYIDTIPPTVDITDVPNIEKNIAFDITIAFSEAVNGFTVDDLTVTGPATASLKSGSDGDSEYTATITPDANSEGDVTIQVSANTVKDFGLNNNTASNKPEVHIDTIPPTVDITDVPDIEKNIAFDITIAFSEAVNGFTVDDIVLMGPAKVALKSGSDGDAAYTVTIIPDADSEGDVTIQVPADAVKDFALNNNTASAVTDPVRIDTILPTVQITDIPQTVQLELFAVTIVFSEDVLEFELEDIILSGDAVVETSELTGTGSTYVLTITPHEDTDGDVAIEVPADVAEDEAANLNTASLPESVFVAPKWIPDSNVRTVVREELGLEEGEDFARQQLADLTTFNGFYREINDLTGLEYAIDLTSAELTGNSISDLTPLAGLTALMTLMLDNNAITDIVFLEGLTDLTTLNLAANRIGDITPLEGLTLLTTLNLSENLIGDLTSLTELILLTHLYLASNDVEDVSPLVNLKNLVVLDVSENPIRNLDLLAGLAKEVKAEDEVPSVLLDRVLTSMVRRALKLGGTASITITDLQGLTTLEAGSSGINSLSGLEHATALTVLVLNDNAITDITPLQGLTALTTLNLDGNAITDITPLEELTALTTLNLGDNNITDITLLEGITELTTLNLSNNLIANLELLAGLTGLTTLELSGNSISNLNIISDLTELLTLNLSDNSIADITLLQNLTELTTLNLGGNSISNPSTISHLTGLTTLDLSGNTINDLAPLAQLTQLTALNLNDNTISNLTPLAGLTNLTLLRLAGNTINVLNSITTLTRLRVLDVSGNNISDVSPLTSLIQLATLDLTSNNISDVQPLVGLVNLGILRLEGNPILDMTSLYPLTQRVPPIDIDIPISQYPPWDVNADGRVNVTDSALVKAALGQSGDDIVNPRTDVNGDGIVDKVDLRLVTNNFDEQDVRRAPPLMGGAADVFLDVETLKTLDKETLQTQLKLLRLESNGSLKYQQTIALLEAFLASLRPEKTRLLANYPNPFNPETWIPYQLAKSSNIQIFIYDVRGVLVRHLDLGHQRAGYYTEKTRATYWDGRDTVGERVASGIYFYQLQADNMSFLRKMVILK